MSTANRKIGFYSLYLKDRKNEDVRHPASIIREVLDYILSFEKVGRIQDLKNSNKFHILASRGTNGEIENLIFESAKYFHRPPLIKKDTAEERDNPKELDEGEAEKTHVSMKFLEDEILTIIEERKPGISISQLVSYLSKFLRTYYHTNGKKLDFRISLLIIPKDNFLSELRKLVRVNLAHLHVDKKLIGSEFLNFSDRLGDLNDDVDISIKAIKYKSIKELVRIIFNSFRTQNTIIKKIRVYGYNDEGNQILLDTDLIKKVEYIEVDIDIPTGIVNSRDIFIKFNEIIGTIWDDR